MLVDSDLRNVSPVVYKTGGDLKMSIKVLTSIIWSINDILRSASNKQIDKNNKRLKGANAALNTRRDLFERVRTFWRDKVGVWCAVDFEAWDRDHSLLTEFGWSLVRWEDGKEIEEKGHMIVEERRIYTNTYVPNHREVRCF